MKSNHFGKLKKVDGVLIPSTYKDEMAFKIFKDSLVEGAVVEIFMEEICEDGSLAQLAYAHQLLKELSIKTGQSSEDLKLFLKEKSSLCYSRTLEGKEFLMCKSLGNCSKDELSLFIQSCLSLAETVGLY